MSEVLFGDQFDEDRFKQGQDHEESVLYALEEAFDPRNIVAVEEDEVHDTTAEDKAIQHVVDYAGIDYLIDTFHKPLFGVNHRNHFNEKAEKFDIRVDTGTKAPSEFDKLQRCDPFDIVPKYATRMKVPDDTVEWFRVVDLHRFIEELQNGLYRDFSWHGQGVTAFMYDYDKLRDRGIVVDEIEIEV